MSGSYLVISPNLFFLPLLILVQRSSSQSCTNTDTRECLGRFNYCSGSSRLGSTCVDSNCRCTSYYYDYCTCLPTVGGCHVTYNADNAVGSASHRGSIQTTYSCDVREIGNSEVHVVGIYEGSQRCFRCHPVSEVNVKLVVSGESSLPLILVFVAYEPINWRVEVPSGVTVDRVLLGGYYVANSAASGSSISAFEKLPYPTVPNGYGTDTGGGNTVELLKYLYRRFGGVASFSGCYRATDWTLRIDRGNYNNTLTTPLPSFTTHPTTRFTRRPTTRFTTRPTTRFTTRPTLPRFTRRPTTRFTTRPTLPRFTRRPTSQFDTPASVSVNIPGIAISLSVLAVMICCVIGTWISYSTRKRKTVATSRASRPVPPRTSPTAQTTVQEDGCTVTATSLPPNYDGSEQIHIIEPPPYVVFKAPAVTQEAPPPYQE